MQDSELIVRHLAAQVLKTKRLREINLVGNQVGQSARLFVIAVPRDAHRLTQATRKNLGCAGFIPPFFIDQRVAGDHKGESLKAREAAVRGVGIVPNFFYASAGYGELQQHDPEEIVTAGIKRAALPR